MVVPYGIRILFVNFMTDESDGWLAAAESTDGPVEVSCKAERNSTLLAAESSDGPVEVNCLAQLGD